MLRHRGTKAQRHRAKKVQRDKGTEGMVGIHRIGGRGATGVPPVEVKKNRGMKENNENDPGIGGAKEEELQASRL